jgi:hypothetical protein
MELARVGTLAAIHARLELERGVAANLCDKFARSLARIGRIDRINHGMGAFKRGQKHLHLPPDPFWPRGAFLLLRHINPYQVTHAGNAESCAAINAGPAGNLRSGGQQRDGGFDDVFSGDVEVPI